jgi:hypothetical protein
MTSPHHRQREETHSRESDRVMVSYSNIRGVNPSRLYSIVTSQGIGHRLTRNEWTLIGTLRNNSLFGKAPMWAHLSRPSADLDTANEACTLLLHPGGKLVP